MLYAIFDQKRAQSEDVELERISVVYDGLDGRTGRRAARLKDVHCLSDLWPVIVSRGKWRATRGWSPGGSVAQDCCVVLRNKRTRFQPLCSFVWQRLLPS